MNVIMQKFMIIIFYRQTDFILRTRWFVVWKAQRHSLIILFKVLNIYGSHFPLNFLQS